MIGVFYGWFLIDGLGEFYGAVYFCMTMWSHGFRFRCGSDCVSPFDKIHIGWLETGPVHSVSGRMRKWLPRILN